MVQHVPEVMIFLVVSRYSIRAFIELVRLGAVAKLMGNKKCKQKCQWPENLVFVGGGLIDTV